MKSRRLVIGCLVSLAILPVVFVGGCLALSIGAGILNYRDDARDRDRAAAEARWQRPLVSTSGRILFVVQTLTTYDVYVVNADGTRTMRLTHTPPLPHRSPAPPTLSPNGTHLAVSSGEELVLLRIDRPGETRRLDAPSGWVAWSPDGRELAALDIDSQKRLRLRVFGASGGGSVRHIAASWPSTADGYDQWLVDFRWSPDGRRFAFLLGTAVAKGARGVYRTRTDLYVAPADGSALRNLSTENQSLAVVGGLAWSPDAARLAFESGRGIGTVDSELKWTEFEIQQHPSRTRQRPAWSPDSKRLAWFDRLGIVTSDPDGARQEELTRGRESGVHPAWSPDGSRIAFVCDEFRALCVLNSDGSGLTRIIDLRSGAAVFEAGAQRISFPVWLPGP